MDSPASGSQFAEIKEDKGNSTLVLAGDWTVDNAGAIENAIAQIPLPSNGSRESYTVRAEGLGKLDTSGALLLKRLLPKGPLPHGLSPQHKAILKFLPDFAEYKPEAKKQKPGEGFRVIGRTTYQGLDFLRGLFTLIGRVFAVLVRNLKEPRRYRFASVVRHMQETGIEALLIIGLLAVLISMVITFQGAVQLKKFGAGIFTIDLTVVALLREMGVLVTAIMVAGRSGSSFAAEIGVMTLRDEVNALRTMGMDPIEVLVAPRVLALVVTLPLLTFVADVVGLIGTGLMAKPLLGVSVEQYLARVQQTADVTMLFVGLIKAPVFALLIAVIGCYNGLCVSGSAESVGKTTTLAVVQSIFMVIMTDALFSVLFSQVGI